MFEIDKTEDGSFCIYIERSFEDVYYGLTLNCRTEIEYNENLNKIAENVEKNSEWSHNTHWLGGNHLEPKVNFEKFASEETLKLLNPDYRDKFLRNNWEKIKEFAEMCKNEIKKCQEQKY
jgi:hypothetical protein